jgi:hypothetical protein
MGHRLGCITIRIGTGKLMDSSSLTYFHQRRPLNLAASACASGYTHLVRTSYHKAKARASVMDRLFNSQYKGPEASFAHRSFKRAIAASESHLTTIRIY